MKQKNARQCRRMVGLDVGEAHVAATQLAFANDGAICLEAAGWADLPPAADRRRVARIVRDLLRHAHVKNDVPVCTSFKRPSLAIKHYRYPNLNEGDLMRALAIEAEEVLQLPHDRLYFDWHGNELAQDGAATGVLVAAPKCDIEQHLDTLAQAGIFPCVMDAGCLAVCNLYLAIRGSLPTDQAVCLVSLSASRADIAVLSCEQGIYARTVYSPAGTWAETESYLTECVEDTIKYHQFKLHGPPVDGMILTGSVPRHEVLVSHLRDVAALVNFWNPVGGLQSVRPHLRPLLENGEGARFATSLGLALRRC